MVAAVLTRLRDGLHYVLHAQPEQAGGLFDPPSTPDSQVSNASSLRIGASSLTTRHQIN